MLWFVGLVTASLAALLIWSRGTPRARRKLLGHTAQPIRGLTSGFAHVVGEVRAAADVLVAPISQRPCVFYRTAISRIVTVQRVSTVGGVQVESEKLPELVDTNEARVQFELADATGVARIDPTHASFEIASLDYSSMLRESSDGETFARVQSYLRDRAVTGGELRVREAVLGVGETAHVFGPVGAPDVAGVCTFARSAKQPLLVQDVAAAARL
jgi:hypothetical protein